VPAPAWGNRRRQYVRALYIRCPVRHSIEVARSRNRRFADGHELSADINPVRFEKSLYDLIRGLRHHKGNEKEYIQKTLKECRAEVRSQDMGMRSYSSRRSISNTF
jgi:hypothetical protein